MAVSASPYPSIPPVLRMPTADLLVRGMVDAAYQRAANPPAADAPACFGSTSTSATPHPPDNVVPRTDSRDHVGNRKPLGTISTGEPVESGNKKTGHKTGYNGEWGNRTCIEEEGGKKHERADMLRPYE